MTEPDKPTILLIAGFGDDGSMFKNLLKTPLAQAYDLQPLNLPGFGAPALTSATTLQALARFVADKAKTTGAKVIIAHSAASIIASLAAQPVDSPLETIFSLEGNITPEDAYFSGKAANFDDPEAFRDWFLPRLARKGETDPIVRRYRDVVIKADPRALWELGCDARKFSDAHVPGQVLMASADVTYFHNPDNCPETTLAWLATHPLEKVILEGASHWPSIDQPALLSEKILAVLAG